jgi:hypothetical protein
MFWAKISAAHAPKVLPNDGDLVLHAEKRKMPSASW